MKTLWLIVSPFTSTSLSDCFSLQSLRYFEIIRCIVKSLISTSICFFGWDVTEKRKLKVFFGVLEFGCSNWYASLPSSLNNSRTSNDTEMKFRTVTKLDTYPFCTFAIVFAIVFSPKILKFWIDVQCGQSHHMRRCLYSLGWPLF